MTFSLIVKRFLSKSLLRRTAASAFRSFNDHAGDDDDDRRSNVLHPRHILKMMNRFTHNPFHYSGGGASVGDTRATEDALLLRVDMPGLEKEHVKISISKGAKETAPRYTCSIDLPDKFYKFDQMKSEMKNGVLHVLVPKINDNERKDLKVE